MEISQRDLRLVKKMIQRKHFTLAQSTFACSLELHFFLYYFSFKSSQAPNGDVAFVKV
jgi:hypothetical protein